jgi:hypothetical protein
MEEQNRKLVIEAAYNIEEQKKQARDKKLKKGGKRNSHDTLPKDQAADGHDKSSKLGSEN